MLGFIIWLHQQILLSKCKVLIKKICGNSSIRHRRKSLYNLYNFFNIEKVNASCLVSPNCLITY